MPSTSEVSLLFDLTDLHVENAGAQPVSSRERRSHPAEFGLLLARDRRDG